MLSKKERDVSEFFIINVCPEMTPSQKKALELAVTKGYYSYPKKTDMDRLCTLMGVSRSTFQAHLQKAQSKVMPFLYGWTE